MDNTNSSGSDEDISNDPSGSENDSVENLDLEEDVEFLDEALLVEENTSGVSVGEIEEKGGKDRDGNDSSSDAVWNSGEVGADDEATVLRAEEDIKSSSRIQRLDLEDLEDMDGGDDDMSFLDRPTSQIDLKQEPDLMDEERREPLRIAQGFDTHESWASTGEHEAAPPETTMEHDLLDAEEITPEEAGELLGKKSNIAEEKVSEGALDGEQKAHETESTEKDGIDEISDKKQDARMVVEEAGEQEAAIEGEDVEISDNEILESREVFGKKIADVKTPEATEITDVLTTVSADGVESDKAGFSEERADHEHSEVDVGIKDTGEPKLKESRKRKGSEGLEELGEVSQTMDIEGSASWLAQRSSFQDQAHRLALRKRWRSLADLTRQALEHAAWAQEGPARAALLLDLGKIYRDHVGSENEARIVFEELLREDPSSRKALEFLISYYEKNSQWNALFRLYLGSVETTWDPDERLERTRMAAEIAQQRIQDPGLAVEAWERLWKLVGGLHQVRLALTQLYREGGRWKDLADFLFEDAQIMESAAGNLQLREVVELCLYGAGDLDRAKETVDRLIEKEPEDSMALLASAEVSARRKDWDSLTAMLGRAEKELDSSGAMGLKRWIADALYQGGRQQAALEIYRKVLEEHPDDASAARAVESALMEAERFDELVELLENMLERADRDEVKAKLLAKLAVTVDEKLGDFQRAIDYWKQHLEVLPENNSVALAGLARLYERIEAYEDLAEVLCAELEHRRDPSGKRNILSRLGRIYSENLHDDEKAEKTWRRMLVLDPEDGEAGRELLQLHKRKGEYEALNRSLVREINLADGDTALELCREAARNVEVNLADKGLALTAWWRVLDRNPKDIEALQAASGSSSKEPDPERWAGFLKRWINSVDEVSEKIRLGLDLGKTLMEMGSEGVLPAASAFERVLALHPGCVDSVKGLVELWIARGDVQGALSVLEYGCLGIDDSAIKADLLRWTAEKLDSDWKREKYHLLRESVLLDVDDDSVLEELNVLAAETDMKEDFLCLLEELSAECEEEKRKIFSDRASRFCRDEIGDPIRAFLLAERRIFAGSADPEVLEHLAELAESTGRYEDLVAIYESLALSADEKEKRVSWLCKAGGILDEKLSEESRAFGCFRRAALADPDDETLVERAADVAEKAGIWTLLERLYVDLLQSVGSSARRMDLARSIHDLLMHKLDNKQGAFFKLVLMYRLSTQKDLEELISKAAGQLSKWEYWLPVMEAGVEKSEDAGTAEPLVELARCYKENLNAKAHCVSVLVEAAENNPEGFDNYDLLESLVDSGDLWGVYSDGLRFIAALIGDKERKIELYRKAAEILDSRLQDRKAAVEVHRRILSIYPHAMDSLELCIEHERESGDQEALRQLLQKWIQTAPETENKVDVYQELAELASAGGQPEKALLAYTQILEIQPDHPQARAALASMGDKLSPEQKLRMMKLELRSAEGERAVKLHMELARHQLEVLDDKEGAVEVLMRLVEKSGRSGEGGVLLAKLFREEGRFLDLAEFLEFRCEELEDEGDRLDSLQEALQVRLEHVDNENPENTERLCRKILEIRPEDRQAGVLLLHTLRTQGRHEEMAELLERSAASQTDETERHWALFDLARIQLLVMKNLDEANRVFQLMEKSKRGKIPAVTAAADIAAAEGNWSEYIRHRERHAKLLDERSASLVYCHLAEVNDEHCAQPERTVSFYRRARMLDDSNDLARQALKALGRRVKDWRKEATLLQDDPGGGGCTIQEKGEKLFDAGRKTENRDDELQFLRRALAVSPNHERAWDRLADMMKDIGDLESSAGARMRALDAFLLRCVPGVDLVEEVERFHACSSAFREIGDQEESASLEKRAFDLDPKDVRAALAVANEKFDEGDFRGSAKIYEELAERTEAAGFGRDIKAHITFRLGTISLRLGDPEKAVASFKNTLEQIPLHAGALEAVGGELVGARRFAEAARMYIRAVPVTDDAQLRSRINSRLGALLEDHLRKPDEAGACYKRALDDGADDLDTLWRSLKYNQKAGRHGEALHLIDAMLDKVENPEDMAGLWVARGQMFSERPEGEDNAMEAFDMALSYDPGCREALEGLGNLLERKGEWSQLLDVLDATQQLLPPTKQAEVLVKMAEVCAKQFGDKEREESYLRLAAEIESSKEILERLHEIYSQDPSREEDAKNILGKLVAFGPPFFEPVTALGKEALESGNRRWAWCLLSPLSEVRKVDKELKSALREMRKEFDGASIPVLSEKDRNLFVRHPRHIEALERVLAEAEAIAGPFGEYDIEDLVEGEFAKIGESTGLGKVLKEQCANLGILQQDAYRAESLDVPITFAKVDAAPGIILQADFARKLVQNEVRYVFGFALELVRPGNTVLAISSGQGRTALAKGLYSALGWYGSRSGLSGKIRGSIVEKVDAETLDRWKKELDSLRNEEPEKLIESYWNGVLCTARRTGLLMAGELHLSIRAMERMEGEKIGRQVESIDELDEKIKEHVERADLLSWACTPGFRNLLT